MTAEPVSARDPGVAELVSALTSELAGGGYSEDETFGYSLEQLVAGGVHLVGVRRAGTLAGIGGIELDGAVAELKRFYVRPEHRGSGVEIDRFGPYVDSATSVCLQRDL